jgi:hypothetical protein
VADYGRRGELLAITLTDVDPTAAEFLRTADEESLLAVIRAQTGRSAWTTPADEPKARPKPAKPSARSTRPPAKRKRRG